MAFKVKPTPSKMVKGVTRAEWCRQISKRPKTMTPKKAAQVAAMAKKGRELQRATTGLFGGKADWQKNLPPPKPTMETMIHKPDKFWHLEDYRQAVSDYA